MKDFIKKLKAEEEINKLIRRHNKSLENQAKAEGIDIKSFLVAELKSQSALTFRTWYDLMEVERSLKKLKYNLEKQGT